MGAMAIVLSILLDFRESCFNCVFWAEMRSINLAVFYQIHVAIEVLITFNPLHFSLHAKCKRIIWYYGFQNSTIH